MRLCSRSRHTSLETCLSSFSAFTSCFCSSSDCSAWRRKRKHKIPQNPRQSRPEAAPGFKDGDESQRAPRGPTGGVFSPSRTTPTCQTLRRRSGHGFGACPWRRIETPWYPGRVAVYAAGKPRSLRKEARNCPRIVLWETYFQPSCTFPTRSLCLSHCKAVNRSGIHIPKRRRKCAARRPSMSGHTQATRQVGTERPSSQRLPSSSRPPRQAAYGNAKV